MRAHLARAERAVDADDQRVARARSRPRTPRPSGPESVRPLRSTIVTEIQSGSSGATSRAAAIAALRVQRVEDRLDQQQVDAALGERRDLLGVRVALTCVEGDRAVGRVVDLRRERERDVQRADRAGDEAAAGLVRGLAGEPRALDVHLVDGVLEPVVGLADAGRREGVRRRDVGAGGEVPPVDVEDDVRPGQVEQVGVAGDVARVVAEALAAVVLGARARRSGASCPRRRRARRSARRAAPAVCLCAHVRPSAGPCRKRAGRRWRRGLFRRFLTWSPSCRSKLSRWR